MRLAPVALGVLTLHLLGAAPRTYPPEGIPAADRVLLAEAFRVAAAVGDSVWAGWHAAPFGVLLVTAGHEYLVHDTAPPAGFTRLGYDSLLASDVFVRPRVFPPTFLATFPAFSAAPVIVVGEPAATGKGSTAWVLTVLHEHFHQLQYSRPGYAAGVEALGLAHGDSTGMWMLQFPFPYDSPAVASRYAEFAASLWPPRAGDPSVAPVERARAALQASVTAEQYRYLAFQLWQEGVARYTELAVARRAALAAAPPAAVRALPDYTSYAAESLRLEREIRAGVTGVKLAEERRVAVYATGAAYALLLDAAAPGWRGRYFDAGFSLDPLLR